MELANQIFYLTIALLTLGLIFPAYVNLDSSNGVNNDTHYWLYTVIAQFLSSAFFVTYPIIGNAALVIGSACQYAVDVFLVLFFISLRREVNKKAAIAMIVSISIVPITQQFEYIPRTLAQGFMMLVLSAWQIYELNKVRHRDRSIYIVFIMGAIILQMLIAGVRIDHTLQYIGPIDALPIPHNRFDEPEHELVIRLGIVALYVLIIVSIGNYHFDKLWHINKRLADEREQQMLSTLNALATARDNETGKHTLRTQHFVKLLAEDLKLHNQFTGVINDAYIETLYLAAPLHDIGKVGIPDHILLKDGRHTPEESEIMRNHAALGVGILNAAESSNKNDVINMAIVIAGSHHERWDGSGYPCGLAGDQIPLAGRIMAIADVYDALTTRRNYKNSWSHKDAVAEIVNNKGIHFEPILIDSFERIHEKFEVVAHTLRDNHAI